MVVVAVAAWCQPISLENAMKGVAGPGITFQGIAGLSCHSHPHEHIGPLAFAVARPLPGRRKSVLEDSITRRKQLILVVDDEPRIVKLLSLKLRLAGYEVIKAGSGPEAIESLRTLHPDLVLLDIIMPVMDGFEVLQQVRSFSKTPVIVLTARPDAISRALALGANEGMVKPFNPDKLVERIRDTLAQSAA